ncbi:hypothetical protein EDD21DRAFT_376123 [Dissophora ornata]|nr:hypothetical protein EDD21DRAFT_376123 [Dissophora ornata]
MATKPPATTTTTIRLVTTTTVPKTTTVPTTHTVTLTTTALPHTTTTTAAAIPPTSSSSTFHTTLKATTTTQPVSNTTQAASNSSDGGGMSGGAVAGMVVGVIMILVGSVVGGFLLLKQRRKRMMLVGRKARGYNGYPEPDLNRPPMAAYRQEGRPSSGHGSSGYGVLPPAGRSMAGESGFYDDRSYHAAAAGLGGARITSTYGGGHGVAGGSGESYTQLSNGKFVATGRRDGDMMPIQTSYHTPEAEGDSPRGSMVLDSYEMERERELDLQQQERMLSLSGGEPVHVAGYALDQPHYPSFPTPLPSSPTSSRSPTSPTSSRSPTSPLGPNPLRQPMPGYNHNMSLASPQPNAYYQQQQHYGPRGGYYQSQPISVRGYPQYPQVLRPQSQYYVPSQQQQQFYPPPPRSASPSGSRMNIMPMRQASPSQYQPPPGAADRSSSTALSRDDVDKGEQERLPGLSSEKQEFEEAQQPQHPDTNMSNLSQESRSDSPPPQTLTSATNSIKSKNSIEPLHHGRSSHLKQVNTISEVLPSMGVGELSGAGAEKEEYLQDQPSTTEPAEDHTPNAEESVASPPPLPMSTKPRS